MEKLQRSEDVTIHWRSYQLRPPGSPPIPAQRIAQIKQSHAQFERMAREQYGLEVHEGPFGIDSRPALIGDKYAHAQGKEEAFHEAVMRAYWQEERDISDLKILSEIAASVGLDVAQFELALNEPVFEAEVSADIQLANEYGLNGVPALIFNDKYLVSGAQPFETLRSVVKKVQEEETV